MDNQNIFRQNMKVLSAHNAPLYQQLENAYQQQAHSATSRYKPLESRSGEIIPAILDSSGTAQALHSTFDPLREAQRLVTSLEDKNGKLKQGFLVLFGLGGGFVAQAALDREDVYRVTIIDFDLAGVAELFTFRDYSKILANPRVTLLVDPSPEEIEAHILESYIPQLAGGIGVLPLRPRTEKDVPHFSAAATAVESATQKVSSDYSVQAHFGKRWFANIIRNIMRLDNMAAASTTPIGTEVAIIAAGPSLDAQLPLLAHLKEKQNIFIIASDTSLPALIHFGIKPDAIVSIDCQHISYYHFLGMANLCHAIPLFLDIASPPLFAGLSEHPFFLSGGHPLATYVSQNFRPLPRLDTSGGNVTYSCLSLAENLGAQLIRVYGADFSYPQGRVYARGTYIYPFFEKSQNRLRPLESQFAAFLHRSPFIEEDSSPKKIYKETAQLQFYRKCFETKASNMNAANGVQIIVEPGMGHPIEIRQNKTSIGGGAQQHPKNVTQQMTAIQFLEQYRNAIQLLPVPSSTESSAYFQKLNSNERQILATLLPIAAFTRNKQPELATSEVIAEVKQSCCTQIDRVLQ